MNYHQVAMTSLICEKYSSDNSRKKDEEDFYRHFRRVNPDSKENNSPGIPAHWRKENTDNRG